MSDENKFVSIVGSNRKPGQFVTVPTQILRSPHLSSGAKVLYAMILSYCWKGDSAFPGTKTLAKALHCNLNTLRRYRRELKSGGWIEIEYRGMGMTNLIRILPLPVDVAQLQCHDDSQVNDDDKEFIDLD